MKILIMLLAITSFAHASFEGKYSSKKCTVLNEESVNATDLFVEISKSNSFVITQNDSAITIDGDTQYWNMAPKIYLKNQMNNGEEIIVKEAKVTDSFISSKFKAVSSFGITKNIELTRATLKKLNEDSFKLILTIKNKNVLSFGFYKTSAKIKCIFSR